MWQRNIYGDEINAVDGNRSEWACVECGYHQLRKSLYVLEVNYDGAKEACKH